MTSRRGFLQRTGTAAGAALASQVAIARGAHAAGSQWIRIALLGSGGRGTGAAFNALVAKPNVRVVAVADAFRDRIEGSLGHLRAHFADRVAVPEDRKFAGLEGYQKAIAADGVDLVILASPPAFRPRHFEAAVNAGKHIFMEKPLSTDVPGLRRIQAANEKAKKRGLAVAVGLHLRHEARYREVIQRLHEGAIGAISYLRIYHCVHRTWTVPRRPDLTEMQYQVRNWYNFTWLSGDLIVERGIHDLDVMNWIKQSHPIRAQGMGGRQVCVAPEHGDIFDHHAVEFEYPDGARLFSYWRQIPGTWTSWAHHAHGVKGRVEMPGYGDAVLYVDGQAPQRFARRKNWPEGTLPSEGHQSEMDDFLAALLAGRPYNECDYAATAAMTALMGRMATYSGQVVEWDQASRSKLELVPNQWTWDTIPGPKPGPDGIYPCAMPGVTPAG
jgi:predicted dehydrogenase